MLKRRIMTRNADVPAVIQPRKAVFRNHLTLGIAAAGSIVGLLLAVPGEILTKSGQFTGAAIFAVLLSALWVLGWSMKIVIDGSGITVYTAIRRYDIPWSQFRGLEVDRGLIISMADGKRLAVFPYGGSLIGDLTHYRSLRKKAAQIEDACDKFDRNVVQDGEYSSRLRINWWPLPIYLATLEGIALVATIARNPHKSGLVSPRKVC
jgi:hypothetical protein